MQPCWFIECVKKLLYPSWLSATCACRGAEGPEPARSRASVAGERPPSPAKHSTGKRQSSSKLLPHLPTSGLLRGSGLASPHGSQNREPFCREAMLRAPASFSPRAHLRLALRLLASETGQCESTDTMLDQRVASGSGFPAPATHGDHSASRCPARIQDVSKVRKSGQHRPSALGLEGGEGAVLADRLHQAARPEQLGLAQVRHQGLAGSRKPPAARTCTEAVSLLHTLHGRVALHRQESLLARWGSLCSSLRVQLSGRVLVRVWAFLHGVPNCHLDKAAIGLVTKFVGPDLDVMHRLLPCWWSP